MTLRFDRLRAHEIGPFHDIDVDFSKLGALVAIVGPNGAGKSSLLELLTGGAIFRECQTRGSLTGLARGRDSWVEVDVVNGAAWRIRQTVDAVSGKGEALVIGEDGRPAFESTKVRAHDEWAAKYMPPAGVLYSSTVAVQGSAGFLALKPADRKSVLLRVLGIERLERMATKAREELSDARGRHATASALVEAVTGVSAADAALALDGTVAAVAAAEAALDVARCALASARDAAAQIAELVRERREQDERRVSLSRTWRTLGATIDDARSRLDNNRILVGRREEIEGAARRVTELREERLRIDTDLATARGVVDTLDQRIARACASDLEAFDYQEQQCEIRERPARPIAARRVVVDEAVAGLDAARKRAADDAAAVDGERLSLDAMLAQTVAGAEDRIVELRDGLRRIGETDDDRDGSIEARAIAADCIREDDEAAAFARDVPGFQATARASLATAQARAKASAADLAACERLAAQAVEVQVAEHALIQCAHEREHVAAGRRRLSADTAEMRAARAAAHAGVADLKVAQARVSAELAQIEPVAARADKLAAAAARIEELDATIAKDEAARVELEAQLAALPDEAAEVPRGPDVAAVERDLRVAEDARHRAGSARAVAERDHAAAVDREAKRAGLEAERDAIAEQISDWKRLADDLGRDGIQALKIDAAGPQLSALANDLLHTCVGPRWTVTIDTQRMGADGRLLESLDVRVLDTEAGRDAPVETYSGGERVLLGEAVSLALAMLACQRSGHRDVTIVRDESGAALDGERGRAYVAMLRRALTLTGARQVLLVTHSPDVAELCDARLHVENGRVEVRA